MSKKEQILHLSADGLGVAAIAKKVKCAPSYVHNVRHMQRVQLATGKVRHDVLPHTYGDLFGEDEREDSMPAPAPRLTTANDTQIGGDHYMKQTLQPWDAIAVWGLDFLAGNVVKYVVRHKDKGGVEDLKKARHYLDKLIEVEEAK